MSETQVITPQLLRGWPLPEPDGGKKTRGTVLVIGGSRFTPGAVLLAGVAALRAGAGRLQLATTQSSAPALSIAVPEAKVIGSTETEGGSMAGELSDHLLALVNEADVVAIGPGLDDIDETLKLLRGVVGAVGEHAGIVLDAYALGALSGQTDLLGSLASRAVLTPNLSEARRLLDHDLTDDLDAEAIEVAQRYGTVVSLYGHVASPDGDVWREESADVGLGTSGSGDVSAGIVAGLMARGCEPAQAACWAAYVHSVAGLRLTTTFGRTGYLARELVDEVATTLSMV